LRFGFAFYGSFGCYVWLGFVSLRSVVTRVYVWLVCSPALWFVAGCSPFGSLVTVRFQLRFAVAFYRLPLRVTDYVHAHSHLVCVLHLGSGSFGYLGSLFTFTVYCGLVTFSLRSLVPLPRYGLFVLVRSFGLGSTLVGSLYVTLVHVTVVLRWFFG